ncbi:MAG: acyl-CoA/acyl-ACP dehydrogenase [Chloroflexi bacterium]|nr:acyl-CoA/acyl-ACP dehydrogenase [Chloroflexota bacterium]MDA1218858.1 acyl-CoA/acyl-ACP dehydrogenase [Chloroflexota bacterium]
MDLGLTEVQQMLKSSAREFLSQECPLTLVREMEEHELGYTGDLWRQITSLGWTGLVFPEQYGGTGGDFIDLAVLLEETGRSLLPGPFFSTVVLGGLTVLDAGTDAQKLDILNKICGGQLRMTLALTEASATLEPWGVETTATRDGDAYRLNGTKLFVPDAHVADLILVAARTASGADPAAGITLFLVPGNSPGVGVSQLSGIASDRQCEVTLDNVSVSVAAILGEVDQGWPIVQRALQRAITGKCLEMLGGADAVLDLTVEYVNQRTQFGRPVGAFQAVQHHCANMAIDVEGSRHIAYQAAWRISAGLPAEREVAMAKAWVSGAYQRVCATAHQCHGAIGFTKEHNLQLYTRRAKAQELSYGEVDFHRELALQNLDRD